MVIMSLTQGDIVTFGAPPLQRIVLGVYSCSCFGGDLQQLAGAIMEKVAETFRGQPKTEGAGKSGRKESFSCNTTGAAARVIGTVVDNGVMAGSSSLLT